jgi:phosphohistidine phosphatase SixA
MILRHGQAEARSQGEGPTSLQFTPDALIKMQRLCNEFTLLPSPSEEVRILTSPVARARETATVIGTMLFSVHGLRKVSIQSCKPLQDDIDHSGDMQGALQKILWHLESRRVIVVVHRPSIRDLSYLMQQGRLIPRDGDLPEKPNYLYGFIRSSDGQTLRQVHRG